jgi:hypothetical protein
MAVVPCGLQVSDWTVRRGWLDRLSAVGIVSGPARRAGLSRSRQHHDDLTVRPVRLAQALEVRLRRRSTLTATASRGIVSLSGWHRDPSSAGSGGKAACRGKLRVAARVGGGTPDSLSW